MNKHQEKILVAFLCGLILVTAGAFAVQPTLASAPKHEVRTLIVQSVPFNR